MGSLTLRPGDLLTLLKRALSIGFIGFVSSTDAIQATGILTSSPVGLTPAEHACLCWTHWLPFIRPLRNLKSYRIPYLLFFDSEICNAKYIYERSARMRKYLVGPSLK